MKHDRSEIFDRRLAHLHKEQERLLALENEPLLPGNGIYERWHNPVVTREHVPLAWRYDLDFSRNPWLMERIGVNSAFNAGALYWQGTHLLMLRIEGNDRKSYFAIAESATGTDGFRFRGRPITMPETDDPDTNIYDMRLVRHEDGTVYGLFCAERKDPKRPDDPTAAMASCGIARSEDLVSWERLPDLVTTSNQQRNVVLHPEFVDGQYAFYTRPQDGFVKVGGAGGICWGLSPTIEGARITKESLLEPRRYHTVTEYKNGQGPPPLKTELGWLHLAHGVRNTAAGLRYVLYLFLTDLEKPWRVLRRPGGHLIAPRGAERVGDVSNVVFCNGWTRNDRDEVFIYYASSDTRTHVATSSIERLLDYCMSTPEDGLSSNASVQAINELIDGNPSHD